MNLDESAGHQSLHSLDGQSLVRSVSASDSRVTKYEHRLQEAFNFYRHEVAILCVLLLRGPQTPGELRTRAERMHPFDDPGDVGSVANVQSFEAKPKAKESTSIISADGERIAHLEEEIASLRKEIADLRQQFAQFRK